MNQISVIIPTYNEEGNIKKLITHLNKITTSNVLEILVIDCGSSDKTVEIVESLGVKAIVSDCKGRAVQMNLGAKIAKGDILHFIHADTLPPVSCFDDVIEAIGEGYEMGCFTYKFDSNFLLLKINSYFTRWDKMWSRGGDQTLFIKRAVFEKLNGYRDDYLIMEEYELIERAREKYNFKIIKKDAIVSARKYKKNGYLRVQIANLLAFRMYRRGNSQEQIANIYRRLLK